MHLQCGPDQAGAAVQRAPPALVLCLRGLGLQGDKGAVTLEFNLYLKLSEDLSLPPVWPDL